MDVDSDGNKNNEHLDTVKFLTIQSSKGPKSKIIENDGLGDCLFYSIQSFIVENQKLLKEKSKNINELRSRVVSYVLSKDAPGFIPNWDRFLNAIIFNSHNQIPSLLKINNKESSVNDAKEDYRQYMSQSGNYGTFTELMVAAEIFGFVGYVIQSTESGNYNCFEFGLSNSDEINEKKPKLFLYFSGPPDRGHFRFLQPESRKKPKLISGGIYKQMVQSNSVPSDTISISNIQKQVNNEIIEKSYICSICSKENESDVITKRFGTLKGLRIHCAKIHGDSNILSSQEDKQENYENEIENIAKFKSKIHLLKRIPKGARIVAANKLTSVIEECISKKNVQSWENLLLFSYKTLFIPEKSKDISLVSSVKKNISNFKISPLKNIRACKRKRLEKEEELMLRVESKVSDFDLRGAVKLLTSNDTMAISNENTLNELKKKHPSPSRQLQFSEIPCPKLYFTVNEKQVKKSILSFKNGSASGVDGFNPQYMKDIISKQTGDDGQKALTALTKLCNLLLSGDIDKNICKYLYGASLCALEKKCGGIRPIAIGNFIRRLVSKLACLHVCKDMGNYLRPHQIGFGTKLGCEAAIHATRSFIQSSKDTRKVILKIDYKNAFNSVERDSMLNEIKDKTPSLYPYLFQCYSNPSYLFFGEDMILSEVGAQQGDPVGPLTFSLSIQPIIISLSSELNVWYLDDGTLGDTWERVLEDFKILIQKSKEIGLEINPSKCELFFCSGNRDEEIISKFCEIAPNITIVDSLTLNLLGSPILEDGFEYCSADILLKFSVMIDRLPKLNAHTGFTLLKNCFGIPKLIYLLRTNPTWKYTNFIADIDEKIKCSLEIILNLNLNDIQWTQSSLPVKMGGLGIRKVEDLALPSFLSSFFGSKDLVSQILSNYSSDKIVFDHFEDAINAWNTLSPNNIPTVPDSQKNWDSINIKRIINTHLHFDSIQERARLLACQSPESGLWLNAIPSKNVGTFLNNNQLRIGIALRLGCDICHSHTCVCGEKVLPNGRHGLSCYKSIGRLPKHTELNQTIGKGLGSINFPSKLEPTGLYRDDGKRPDGMTLIPWSKGQIMVWDSTCVDTFAQSYINRTSFKSGEAAEIAVKRKHNLYKNIISQNYKFIAPAVETLGSWSVEAKLLFGKSGKNLAEILDDIRCSQYFKQKISLAIQKGNASMVMGTIPNDLKMEEIFKL